MPRSSRYGRGGELPDTLQRSCKEAQELFAEAHASAVRVHGEGDRALTRAAACIRETFRKFEVTARLSGDEFVAMITEAPGLSRSRRPVSASGDATVAPLIEVIVSP